MFLHELLEVPFNNRDYVWESRFFKVLTESNLKLLSPEAKPGPDGWPYLLTEVSSEASESVQKIIFWLSDKGIGLAINPHKEYPDFVFTYGMLWYFRETGLFYNNITDKTDGKIEFIPQKILGSNNPTTQYLPTHVRSILKTFFRDQGILFPKILVVSLQKDHYDLAFSLESLANPPTKEHPDIAEAISWFLPPHYSILLVSEQGLPSFYDL